MFSIVITSNKDPSFFREPPLTEKITIGRDPACSIFLPDPDKHISRLHALIEHKDGSYHLTVASKTNSLLVNNLSYQHGKSILLKDGDHIAIRHYLLTISISAVYKAASALEPIEPIIKDTSSQEFNFIGVPSTDQSKLLSPWPVTSTNLKWGSENDPFGLDDLIAKPVAKPNFGADPFKVITHEIPDKCFVAGLTPLHTDNDVLNNKFLDPLDALNKRGTINSPRISGSGVTLTQNTPLADFLPPLSSSSQNNWNSDGAITSSLLVDLGCHHPLGTKSLEHVHDINRPYTPAPVPETAPFKAAHVSATPAYSTGSNIDDPFAGLTFINKPPFAPVPSPQASYPPPAPSPASDNTQSDFNDSINTSNSNAQDSLLLDAFRKAAGLGNQPMQHEEAIAYLESAGTIVRTAIEGITSLLASRSMMKGELGAEDRTMVASRDNNPLKLMPDIHDVMQFLFNEKKLNSKAYLSPVQSISGACEDLVYHELGTAVGMRAAVEGSIRSFNPKLIEAEFEKSGKKFVINRNACLWEAYVGKYSKIEASMADDVGRIFERDFRRAYDEQIRKLKRK